MVIVLREVAREVVILVAMAVEVVVEVDKIHSMILYSDTYVRDPTGLGNRVDPPYTFCRASRSKNQPSVSSQPSASSWPTGSQTQIQLGESSKTDLTNTNTQSDMDLQCS